MPKHVRTMETNNFVPFAFRYEMFMHASVHTHSEVNWVPHPKWNKKLISILSKLNWIHNNDWGETSTLFCIWQQYAREKVPLLHTHSLDGNKNGIYALLKYEYLMHWLLLLLLLLLFAKSNPSISATTFWIHLIQTKPRPLHVNVQSKLTNIYNDTRLDFIRLPTTTMFSRIKSCVCIKEKGMLPPFEPIAIVVQMCFVVSENYSM